MKTALRAIGYSAAISVGCFAFLATLIGACIGITEAALSLGVPLQYAGGAPLALFVLALSAWFGTAVARGNKESSNAVA